MKKLFLTLFAFALMFSGMNSFAKEGASSEIPLTFSGYVHTATTYNMGDNEDENNNFHTFSDDDYTMTPSAQLGVSNDYFVIDALFGSIAQDVDGSGTDFFLHQAYGMLPVGAATLMVGHFDTMLGNEVINPADNVNITRSFLFGYSINFQNTGVRASYEPTEINLVDEFYLGIGNGSDVIYDEGENQGKTIEAAVGKALGDASIFLAMNYGPETANDSAIRQTYTAVFGMPLGSNLSLTLNGVYAQEDDAGETRTDNSKHTANWYGYAGYLVYDHSDRASIALRGEYFKDKDGSRLSFGSVTSKGSWDEGNDDATLKSLTITPQFLIGEHGILRAEFRRDFANHAVFGRQAMTLTPSTETAQNTTQDTVSLQYIVSF
tara:strand:- start:135 stop:1268 length:1134 start_codon:yes stop_codon:yes gene_type:complete